QHVIVAVRRGKLSEGFSSIDRAIGSGVEDVNDVGILGVGEEVGVIPGALAEAMVVVNQAPVFATIVRAIKSAFVILDQRVHAVWLRGDSDSDSTQHSRGKPVAFDLLPCGAAIC